jgi:hypothetical protein
LPFFTELRSCHSRQGILLSKKVVYWMGRAASPLGAVLSAAVLLGRIYD